MDTVFIVPLYGYHGSVYHTHTHSARFFFCRYVRGTMYLKTGPRVYL